MARFAALALAVASACAPGGPAETRSNLLLVVVDTLRADRLSAYGWHEPTSPQLEALATRGVLFERTYSQAPQTQPSFSTILTGTHPPTHGVRANGMFSLSPSAVTLAETLAAEGYRTGAFVAGFPLDARFGFDQGFETYHDEMTWPIPMDGIQRRPDGSLLWMGHHTTAFESSAEDVTDASLSWLREARDGPPFFLMVHYFDPHHDYLPPESLARRFVDPYSGEVAKVDRAFGRLLAELEAAGLEEETLVVFTADHGECLGEQGRYQHHEHITEASLRIPLVLRGPGVEPAGARITGLARSVDVMPTVLDLLGVAIPVPVQGRSLRPAFAADTTGVELSYFETLWGRLESEAGVTRIGVSDGRWKLVRHSVDARKGRPAATRLELYDLARDPQEIHDRASTEPERLRELGEHLDRFVGTLPEGRAEPITASPDLLERLRALGYL